MQFAQFSMLSEMCQSSANTDGIWQMNKSNNKESARKKNNEMNWKSVWFI